MEKNKCKQYEGCSAPLCPLDNSVTCGIWFSDEEICQSRKFQKLPWVKKQKLVVKAGATSDKYFTVEMLESKSQIRKGIEGIDPDQPLETADRAERRWMGKKAQRVTRGNNKKTKRVVSTKKPKLKKTTRKTRKNGLAKNSTKSRRTRKRS